MELSKAKIESFLGKIEELEVRVRELERANPLVGSLPRGTAIVVVDSDGELIAEIGRVDNDTATGVALYDGNGTTLLKGTTDEGMLAPNLAVPMRASGSAGQIAVPNNGAAFSLVYDGLLDEVQHRYLRMQITVNCDAGTTGIVRLRTSAGQTSATTTINPSSGATRTLFMELTSNLGTPSLALWCEVNNNGGAGSVRINAPILAVGDYANLATTGGFWL